MLGGLVSCVEVIDLCGSLSSDVEEEVGIFLFREGGC